MPIISRFLGITIAIFWDDHLPPHFHARYGEYEITIAILTGEVQGLFPKKELYVMPWNGANYTKTNLWNIGNFAARRKRPNPLTHWSNSHVPSRKKIKVS